MSLWTPHLCRRAALGGMLVLVTAVGVGGDRPGGRRNRPAGEPTTSRTENPGATEPIAPQPSGGDPKVIKFVSSLPRTGSAKAQTDTIVNGIRMALDEAGYRSGEFTIKYEDLDDATAADGKWNTDRETANANKAMQDPDVMV